MSLLDHIELSICKGVGPTPSDTLSAEQPLTIVDLMTSGSAFALVDFTPNIPSLKSGGIWADSSITDGRTLIAGVNTNVIETMTIQLTGSTIADFASQFAKFQRLIQDARDFWDTFYQIEPVYIRWWANQAPGPQFALIYNIDMDVEWDDSNLAQATLTLKIEREFGWRGVRPGGNPKEWTAYKNRVPFNVAYADLIATTNHLFTSSLIYNSIQWQTKDIIGKANYIDIPATQIDGDLPALATIIYDVSAGMGAYNLFLSRSTKPTSVTLKDGNSAYQFYDLAAAHVVAASLGTDTTLNNDLGGIIYTPTSASARRAQISYATDATNITRLTWTSAPTGVANTPPVIDENMFRGKFAAFLRCRQVGGAANDIKMSLQYGNVQNANDTMVITTEVSPTIQAGAGDTADWPVTYMGFITMPPDVRAAMGADGRGLAGNADNASNGFRIQLFSRRTAGVGVLYVCDLILVPVDECALQISSLNGTTTNIMTDNTGYFNRGQLDPYAARIHYDTATTFASTNKIVALQGDAISLKPRVNNRIYALVYDGVNLSAINVTFIGALYIDIIPRWSGIRDA